MQTDLAEQFLDIVEGLAAEHLGLEQLSLGHLTDLPDVDQAEGSVDGHLTLGEAVKGPRRGREIEWGKTMAHLGDLFLSDSAGLRQSRRFGRGLVEAFEALEVVGQGQKVGCWDRLPSEGSLDVGGGDAEERGELGVYEVDGEETDLGDC